MTKSNFDMTAILQLKKVVFTIEPVNSGISAAPLLLSNVSNRHRDGLYHLSKITTKF